MARETRPTRRIERPLLTPPVESKSHVKTLETRSKRVAPGRERSRKKDVMAAACGETEHTWRSGMEEDPHELKPSITLAE